MFNSRDPQFRNPTGAVKEDTSIHFRITLPRELNANGACLIIDKDSGGREVLNMFWCGMNGEDKEWWECDYTPTEKGLYFYNFEYQTYRGHRAIYKGIGGQGESMRHGSKWQLTVYDKNFTTPDWLAGGIMYQIFPDRFYKSENADIQNVPQDRALHQIWNEGPQWWPNEKGVITNSDYFSGNLKGIVEKLPYLEELGVTCIYLNPIFEAHSSHRYDTADYSKIDPLLGSEEDYKELCAKAKEHGIRLMLDGVFSHTGSDSVYFNREGRYDTNGAFNSQSSPYSSWYSFKNWPMDYECWWNFITLPNLNETNPQYNEYINGDNGIIQSWLQKGASGWRLDVADELPDEFIDNLNKAVKSQDPEAIVLGEVWEDASNKSAYGYRRRYLLGGQLDTVMNYPFRYAIFSFLNGDHSSLAMDVIENILENYPPECIKLLMNHIGTHDTERALTILGGEAMNGRDRQWQANTHLSHEQREIGLAKLRLASLLQYTLPGVPCVYYGDEAGMEGYRDPFNRQTYPWGYEDKELISWYKKLSEIRKSHPVFKEGGLRNIYSHKNIMSFERFQVGDDGTESRIFIAVNRSDENAPVPVNYENTVHIYGTRYTKDFKLPPYGCSIFMVKD